MRGRHSRTASAAIAPDWACAAPLRDLFDLVEGAGGSLWLVGGAVRDLLRGAPATDYDFATTLTPPELTGAAHARKIKTVPTGIAHGTVTVIPGGTPFQVTTLREDIETDGRHAKIRYGADWRKDAARRDFTINALYCGRDGKILDPFDGVADLNAGTIRFIGDPATRIAEDHLRILRFFRFFAKFGRGPPDAQGLAASIAARGALAALSAERVRQEIMRLLRAPRACDALAAMHSGGILRHLFAFTPDLEAFARLRALDSLTGKAGTGARNGARTRDKDHEAGTGGNSFALHVSALARPETLDIDHTVQALRMTRSEAARLRTLSTVRLDAGAGMNALRTALYRHGRSCAGDALRLTAARAPTAPPDHVLQAALKALATLPMPEMPVRGRDFVQPGVSPGAEIHHALQKAETRWIESGFTATREELMATHRESESQDRH